jgi:two-component sensor histidine kinase
VFLLHLIDRHSRGAARLGKSRKLKPWLGALAFAALFLALRVGFDYWVRNLVAGQPADPWWTVLSSMGLGTLIASWIVYRLLRTQQRQRMAIERLNHEIRNGLQVLSYLAALQGRPAEQAREAFARIEKTLREVSAELEG